jgi:hypothetical protein
MNVRRGGGGSGVGGVSMAGIFGSRRSFTPRPPSTVVSTFPARSVSPASSAFKQPAAIATPRCPQQHESSMEPKKQADEQGLTLDSDISCVFKKQIGNNNKNKF